MKSFHIMLPKCPVIEVEVIYHDQTNERNRPELEDAFEIVKRFLDTPLKSDKDYEDADWASQFPEVREQFPEVIDALRIYYTYDGESY